MEKARRRGRGGEAPRRGSPGAKRQPQKRGRGTTDVLPLGPRRFLNGGETGGKAAGGSGRRTFSLGPRPKRGRQRATERALRGGRPEMGEGPATTGGNRFATGERGTTGRPDGGGKGERRERGRGKHGGEKGPGREKRRGEGNGEISGPLDWGPNFGVESEIRGERGKKGERERGNGKIPPHYGAREGWGAGEIPGAAGFWDGHRGGGGRR